MPFTRRNRPPVTFTVEAIVEQALHDTPPEPIAHPILPPAPARCERPAPTPAPASAPTPAAARACATRDALRHLVPARTPEPERPAAASRPAPAPAPSRNDVLRNVLRSRVPAASVESLVDGPTPDRMPSAAELQAQRSHPVAATLTQNVRDAAMLADTTVRCDGDHRGPRPCADPECWLRIPPPITGERAPEIEAAVPRICPICDGMGTLETGSGECPACNGTGEASERLHAQFSPSALKNFRICPAYRPQEREPDEMEFANEGTLLHNVCEQLLTNSNSVAVDTLTEEQRQCVMMCMDYVSALTAERVGLDVHRELRLDIAGVTFGTADVVIYNASTRHLDVVDFKFGRWSVDDAETNDQGYAYILGAFERWPDALTATIHFLQPRRDEVSTHEFTRDPDVFRLTQHIQSIIHAASEPNPRECYNESNCQFCGRQAECATLRRMAVEIAGRYVEPGTPQVDILDFLHELQTLHSSEITDGATLAKLLSVAKVMERWAGSVKAHALQMHLSGTDIPGYELRERAGARSVKPGDDSWGAFGALTEPQDGEAPMLTLEEFIRACAPSIDQLSAAYSATVPHGRKAAAKAKLSAVLAACGVVTQGGSSHYLAASRQ